MKRTLVALVLLSMTCSPALAQTSPSVAEVVREDARTITVGDGAALLALFDEDSRIYATPEHPDRLDGPLARTMGTHAERRESFPKIHEGGPVRLDVAELITAGDMAVSKNIFTAPNGRQLFNLVIYRVRDGIISDLWHPARTPALDQQRGTATRSTVDRLLSGLNRRDEDAVRQVLHSDVRHFDTSGAAHAIGDVALTHGETPEVPLRRLLGSDGAQVAIVEAIAFNEYLASRYTATHADGRREGGLLVFRVTDGRVAQVWRIQRDAI